MKLKLTPIGENFMLVNGTHLVGEVEATFDEMVLAFGEPHENLGDAAYDETNEKVRCEWNFTTGRMLTDADLPTWAWVKAPCEEVVTLYDWKEWRRVRNVKDWHIGGHTPAVVEIIKARLDEVRRGVPGGTVEVEMQG